MINWDNEIRLMMPNKDYRRIEELAVSLYQELNIKDAAFDVFEIAHKKGYQLKPYSKLRKKACEWLRAEECDAINYYDERTSSYVIIYDDMTPLTRQRFSIMHEIGHILLGHKQESDLARIQANYFAAYALAPSPLIFYFEIEDYIELAEKFNISKECAMFCEARYNNWLNYGGEILRPYECALVTLFNVA